MSSRVPVIFVKFKESLPPCLVCKTIDKYKDFYDLAIRSVYYSGLDNDYLQKELSKLPETDQTLQRFYEESCPTESRAKHYKDTQSLEHALDHNTTPTVALAKSDTPFQREKGRNDRSRWRGREFDDNSGAHSVATHTPNKHHHSLPVKVQKPVPHIDSSKSNTDSGVKPRSNNGGAEPKQKCYYCNKLGHMSTVCRSRKRDVASNSTTHAVDATARSLQADPAQNNSSNHFMMKKLDVNATRNYKRNLVAPGAQATSPRVLSVTSIQTGPPLPVIKASFIFEGRFICGFEVDTDASRTMISINAFKKASYVAIDKPTLGPEQTMRLADGTVSTSKCRLTHLLLARADNPQDVARLPVLVVEGPNLILGQCLYDTCEHYNNLTSSQVPDVSWWCPTLCTMLRIYSLLLNSVFFQKKNFSLFTIVWFMILYIGL